MNDHMENKRQFSYLILLVIAVILLFTVFTISSHYIVRLERQIDQRDSLIRELSISDALVREYFNIEQDSSGHRTSYSLKDEKKTRVVERIETIKESQFSFDGKNISANEVAKKYLELQESAQKLNSEYNALIRRFNSLVKKYNTDIDSLREVTSISGLKLSSIQNKYGISAKYTVSGNSHMCSLSGTEQIDSALLLLPYYRDCLEYEQIDDSWNVTLPKNKGRVKIQIRYTK